MERKSFQDMSCPVALALERVGEWWSILILRDATHGITRFDEFEKSLGISPNSLSRRLGALVQAGLLGRRRYSEHPPRDEYVSEVFMQLMPTKPAPAEESRRTRKLETMVTLAPGF